MTREQQQYALHEYSTITTCKQPTGWGIALRGRCRISALDLDGRVYSAGISCKSSTPSAIVHPGVTRSVL
jgi:hypothetical protein